MWIAPYAAVHLRVKKHFPTPMCSRYLSTSLAANLWARTYFETLLHGIDLQRSHNLAVLGPGRSWSSEMCPLSLAIFPASRRLVALLSCIAVATGELSGDFRQGKLCIVSVRNEPGFSSIKKKTVKRNVDGIKVRTTGQFHKHRTEFGNTVHDIEEPPNVLLCPVCKEGIDLLALATVRQYYCCTP